MPEPTEAVQRPQDQIASTPPIPADQPTTVKTSDKSETLDTNLMDLLDIPLEVQSRLNRDIPKAEKPKAKPEEEEPEVQIPEKDEEAEELEPDEEEAEEQEAVTAGQPQKVDKRQKRINRLTRKKAELEEQLDKVATENYRLREQMMQQSNGQQKATQPDQLIGGQLPVIEANLKAQDAVLRWCDQNADGGNVDGKDGEPQFVDAPTVREWRREAEVKRQDLVVDRKDERKRLVALREQCDRDAFALWPEMFDSTKQDYQEAVAIIRQYPFIASLPEANLALGQLLEGRRSIRTRAQKPNGELKKHRDIDERVFTTPRVPIAPHTSEPPIRESTPSSKKLIEQARSRLINDQDGGVESLANMFAAMDAAERKQPSGRGPVKS